MSLNDVMSRLRDAPEPPVWDTRGKLALALMRHDRQVSCLNCKQRKRPCKIYTKCKEDNKFTYFDPRDTLLALQLGRVGALIDAIDKLN